MPFISHQILWLVFLLGVLLKLGVSSEADIYSHQWAVEVEGGEAAAIKLADKHNFKYLGKILGDVHHFEHRRVSKRSLAQAHAHHAALTEEPHVRWAEQQKVLRRSKRDYKPREVGGASHTVLTDPEWSSMWYLNRGGGLDMNVEKAWAVGATGKAIVVTILDDGLEKDHPDLLQNYDPQASTDVNARDPDPMPRYDLRDTNRHGTRCAGEVAAVANNSNCGVGVAYEASIGGVRMLDGDVTDAVEARSLSHNPNHIDIYSASWGPDDDGKTVDGPGQMATRAFVDGINNGRHGKGSIFVWASGNGGRDKDNCNCDGYTNSIWTLSISSATEKGRVPWYSEACSSTLATTYSSGAFGERQIITTDLHHKCTDRHTGTSASAPLAAGICALALHANNELTWRDMQHIVVRTARPEYLDADDWQTNGVGRKVSHRFGYGIMDAHGMVELARNWSTVPQQKKCEISAPHLNKLVPRQSFVTLDLEVSECPNVNFLEHVQAKVSLTADERGNIEIFLISPAGTRSHLLALRPKDSSRRGFNSWPFMTVHMWGEQPLGIWKLEIHNSNHYYTTNKVVAKDWSLIFYGTAVRPGTNTGDTPTLNVPSDNIVDEVSHSPHANEGNPEEREKVDEVNGLDGVRSSGWSLSPAPSTLPLSVGCLAMNEPGKCIECDERYYHYAGTCVLQCPDGYFPEEDKRQKYCTACHYSCKKCSGALDYQCEQCWPDAVEFSPKKVRGTYCYAKDLVESLESQKTMTNVSVALLITLGLAVAGLALLMVVCRFRHGINHLSNNITVHTSSSIIPTTKVRANYRPISLQENDHILPRIPFEDLSSTDEEI